MAGLGSSFPAADPGLHWWLDGSRDRVLLVFFPSDQQRFPKKEIFPVLLKLCSWADTTRVREPSCCQTHPSESWAVRSAQSLCLQHLDHTVLI